MIDIGLLKYSVHRFKKENFTDIEPVDTSLDIFFTIVCLIAIYLALTTGSIVQIIFACSCPVLYIIYMTAARPQTVAKAFNPKRFKI